MNVKDLASGHFVSDEWNLATFAAWQFYLCVVPVTSEPSIVTLAVAVWTHSTTRTEQTLLVSCWWLTL